MPIDFRGQKIYKLSDIASMTDAPQPYLLEHLIFRGGKTVLVGKPKLGKSWLSIKIGTSISQGVELLGLKVVESSVLYLEFDRRFLTNSLNSIAPDKSGEFYILKYLPVALNTREGYNFLDELLNAIEPTPQLLIIDHKSACFAGKENDDDANRKWLQTLDQIAVKHKVTYLVIAQAPKSWNGNVEDIVDLPFGSRLLTAWADTIVSIDKKGNNFRKLEIASNYGILEPIIYDSKFNVSPSEVEFTKEDVAKEILLARWEDCKYPHTSKIIEEVSKEVGCSFKTAWSAYREIKEDKRRLGKIEKGVEEE